MVEANDYVGKGLSGGTIAITADRSFRRGDVLAGNTVLYGRNLRTTLCLQAAPANALHSQ